MVAYLHVLDIAKRSAHSTGSLGCDASWNFLRSTGCCRLQGPAVLMTFEQMFEELQTLRSNPEAFASRRNAILDEYFQSLPEDQALRARQFQWRLDNELRPYRDPIVRMNKMVEIFWTGVREFHQVLTDPLSFKTSLQRVGQVIPLKR